MRVFQLDSSSNTWTPVGQALEGEGDEAGRALALSADGTIVALGARFHRNGRGQARVYQFDSVQDQWTLLGQALTGPTRGERLGDSLDLSANGYTLAVGSVMASSNAANGPVVTGAVRVFRFDHSQQKWQPLGNNSIYGAASYDQFGDSVAISADGTVVAAGSIWHNNAAGQVRVFELKGGTSWTQKGSALQGLATNDRFGSSVALSSDGSIVAAGATLHDG